jgi:hypothetical protein
MTVTLPPPERHQGRRSTRCPGRLASIVLNRLHGGRGDPQEELAMAGRALVAVAAVALVLGLASPASAATSMYLNPDRAVVGTRVTIYNGCLGVTDHAPARIRVAFIDTRHPDQAPDDAGVPRAMARRVSPPSTYAFSVPRMAPGRYWVRLECRAGDWETNTAEGGTPPVRVLAAPDTSTVAGPRPPPDRRPLLDLLLLVVAASSFGLLASRRSRHAMLDR